MVQDFLYAAFILCAIVLLVNLGSSRASVLAPRRSPGYLAYDAVKVAAGLTVFVVPIVGGKPLAGVFFGLFLIGSAGIDVVRMRYAL